MAEDSNAVMTVINTPELLENILLNLGMSTLLRSQQVNRQFQATIGGSLKLQRALWFAVDPVPAPRSNLKHDVNPLIRKTRTHFGIHLDVYTPGDGEVWVKFSDLGLLAGLRNGSWRKMVFLQTCKNIDYVFNIILSYRTHEQSAMAGWCKDIYVEKRYGEAPTLGQMVDELVEKHCYMLGESCPLHDSHGR